MEQILKDLVNASSVPILLGEAKSIFTRLNSFKLIVNWILTFNCIAGYLFLFFLYLICVGVITVH